jgi:hypothetical protein
MRISIQVKGHPMAILDMQQCLSFDNKIVTMSYSQ